MKHTIGYLTQSHGPAQNLSVIHSQHLGGVENVQDIEDRMWKHVQRPGDDILYWVSVKWEEGDNPSSRQVEAVSQKLIEALGVEECPAYVVRDDSADTPSIDLAVRVKFSWIRPAAGERVASALQQLDREFGWGEFQGKSRDADVKQEDVPDIQRDEEVYSEAVAWLEDGAKFNGYPDGIPDLLREDAEKFMGEVYKFLDGQSLPPDVEKHVIKASKIREGQTGAYCVKMEKELRSIRGEGKMSEDDIWKLSNNVWVGLRLRLKEKLPELKQSLGIIREKLREARHMTPSSSLSLATRLAGRSGEQGHSVGFER